MYAGDTRLLIDPDNSSAASKQVTTAHRLRIL
jgi:hypothetical protein